MADYWREEFDALPASIDGVPFRIETATTVIGRRDPIQRFPGTPYTRSPDLGPEADDFTVNGYLVGRDYHKQRRALEEVFRKHGPKLLVHPYRGRIPVLIEGGLQLTEEMSRGGFCRFSFRCVRHYNDDAPYTREPPRTSAARAIEQARVDGLVTFGASLSVEPSLLDAFLARVDVARAVMADSIGMTIASATSVSSRTIALVDGLRADMAAAAQAPEKMAGIVATAARAVMLAPFEAGTSAIGQFELFTDGDRIRAMLDIASRFGRESGLASLTRGALEAPSAEETDAQQELRHARALTAAFRCEAACSIVEAVLSVIPESTEQAAEVLEALDTLLWSTGGNDPDALMTAVDPDFHRTLSIARAAATRFLRETSLALPGISVYEVPADTNLLLLTQELLGDASRWEAIAHRNQLDTPDFIPRGTRIEFIAA